MVRARGMRQSQTGVAERARVQRARRARAALPARQGAAHGALARHCGHTAYRLILETLPSWTWTIDTLSIIPCATASRRPQ